MCGRFVSAQPPERLAAHFGIEKAATRILQPSWNVAPTQDIYAVHEADGTRTLDVMRWGFVPRWAKDLDAGPAPINARSETVADKPMFKGALRDRRCLIPADGFYEWQARPSGPKQPYYIRLKDGEPLAMAGIWGEWGEIKTCAILTTQPNAVVSPIHNRMPAVISKPDWTEWLDPSSHDVVELGDLLVAPAAELEAAPVSRKVNNPHNDDESLIETEKIESEK